MIADHTTPCWPFIEAWSSDAFLEAGRVTGPAGQLRGRARAVPWMRTAVRRVMRFELAFWNAVYGGETW
jgi:hypothetical protein